MLESSGLVHDFCSREDQPQSSVCKRVSARSPLEVLKDPELTDAASEFEAVSLK